jgi:predicted site-specific integrase-resolvase
MTLSSEKQFLTAKELALRLGVSSETAGNYIRGGVVPSTLVNGRRCVPVGALMRWIADKDEEALRAVKSP